MKSRQQQPSRCGSVMSAMNCTKHMPTCNITESPPYMRMSDQVFWLVNGIMDFFFLTNKTNFGNGLQKVIFDVIDL